MSLPVGTPASVLTGPPYRILGFVALSLVALIVFRGPLSALIALALQDDRYTHTVLMPFLSVGLIYLQRKRIFAGSEYCARFGIPGILAGFGLFGFASWWPPLTSLPISMIALASANNVPPTSAWTGVKSCTALESTPRPRHA